MRSFDPQIGQWVSVAGALVVYCILLRSFQARPVLRHQLPRPLDLARLDVALRRQQDAAWVQRGLFAAGLTGDEALGFELVIDAALVGGHRWVSFVCRCCCSSM